MTRLCLLGLLFFFSFPSLSFSLSQSDLQKIKLPAGFQISLYATQLRSVRELALGDNGIVYAGSRYQGNVYAILPSKDGGQASRVITIKTDLEDPNGVAFYKGDLYVAGVKKIVKYPNITSQLSSPPKPVLVTDKLPKKTWHGYKYIKFGPDGWLYVAVGMPCNTCNYRGKNDYFGTILRMRPDGKEIQIYAKGIRNSVGFDWNPKTKILWFTDNGQDWMGDNLPPDKINRAAKSGMDFGFPFFYGNNIPTPDYKDKNIASAGMTMPAYNLQAHTAPLGLEFYRGSQFPSKYQSAMFIAQHGSWNRSRKVGYQVVVAFVNNGQVKQVQPFASGWLQDEDYWGRPVDVLSMPDGSLLVSDDYAGIVYRIAYRGR